MNKAFYITTPIYYVNDRPHIGHASTTVWADVQARYRRQRGDKTFFLTGLDEHGTKVQQAAQKREIPPQQHCDEMAPHFQGLWTKLNISYDDFVRTTEPRHKNIVQETLTQLHSKGAIYKKKYKGWYSRTAEQFVTEKEMVDEKLSAHLGDVIELEEDNYFFRMSDHQAWLIDYIHKHEDWIRPANRRNEVFGALQKPLEDLCISRPKARLSWGIPLPFDSEYVTYVWFDALVNYISIPGYGSDRFAEFWPADYHLIAKDILTPHAIYWSTMLHALGLPMPKYILAHGWWLFNQTKMSKTLGNVVNPLELIERHGVDAVRYFICRELLLASDTDFSEERFVQRFNSDLANDFGNLVNRSISMIHRYRGGVVPAMGLPAASDEDLKKIAVAVVAAYHKEMEAVSCSAALESIWKLVSRANRYVDENTPWKLARDPQASERLDTVLYHLTQTMAWLANLVVPVMPETATKIASQLNTPLIIESKLEPTATLPDFIPTGHVLGQAVPLFPRQTDSKQG